MSLGMHQQVARNCSRPGDKGNLEDSSLPGVPCTVPQKHKAKEPNYFAEGLL